MLGLPNKIFKYVEERAAWFGFTLPVLGLVLRGPLQQLLPGHEGEHRHARQVLVQVRLHHGVENLVIMY